MSEIATPVMEHDGRQLREKAVAARHAVVDLAAEAKSYAADRLAAVKNTTASTMKSTNETVVDFVQKNPYKTIAIAAGLGLIAGMLLKRK